MSYAAKTSGLAIALCTALACATGGGSTYAELAGTLPTPAAGNGRVFLYMTDVNEVPGFRPELTLDGALIGYVHQGSFRYVDRPVGFHEVGVHVPKSAAAFGGEGATTPVAIELRSGEPAYIRVDVEDRAGMIEPVLTLTTNTDAPRDMPRLVLSETN